MRGAKDTRECAACGKLLTRLLSQAKGELWFCNHACQISLMPPPGTISKKPNPYRGQKVTRPCVQCGNPATRYLTPKNIDTRWTCSYACMGKEQRLRLDERGIVTGGKKPRKGDTVRCSVCSKPFYRQPAYIKQARHLCSTDCNRIWQTKTPVVKQCERCGKELILKPSQAARQYCSKECGLKAKTKGDTGEMHNGRPVLKNFWGYLSVYEPNHPAANKHSGRVLQHRLIVEKRVGRYLTPQEHVNHINHVRDDNRDENLEILSPSEHSRETGEFTRKRRASAQAELEAYRQKFGPLPID